jgi:hypothetical protein
MKPIEEMTDRELDWAIAIEVCQAEAVDQINAGFTGVQVRGKSFWRFPDGRRWLLNDWNPSEDLNHCREAELQLEKMGIGLALRYLKNLKDREADENGVYYTEDCFHHSESQSAWRVKMASPRLCCIEILKVVRERREKPSKIETW